MRNFLLFHETYFTSAAITLLLHETISRTNWKIEGRVVSEVEVVYVIRFEPHKTLLLLHDIANGIIPISFLLFHR